MRNDTKLDVLWEEVEELKKSGGGGSDLPDVDVGDVGKVLMVGDTGEWEADDLPPQLPEVDTSDAGKILSVSVAGEWVLSDPSGGYSTITGTPVKTGNNIYNYDEYILAVDTPTEFGMVNPNLPIHGITEVYGEILGDSFTRKIDLSDSISFNTINPSYPGDLFTWISGKYVANVFRLIIKFY